MAISLMDNNISNKNGMLNHILPFVPDHVILLCFVYVYSNHMETECLLFYIAYMA